MKHLWTFNALALGLAVSVATTAAAGCGDGKKGEPGAAAKPTDGPAATPVELTAPVLGVDAVKKLNYVYGSGDEAYEKVIAAKKATPRDWAALQAAAEATLVLDANHLDAHRDLADALAQKHDFAGAAKHLLIALGGDWLRWGPTLEADPDLAGFLASPDGAKLKAINATLRDDAATKARTGVRLLARRSTFKWPSKPGAQWATSRGELYSYDLDSKRFLRLTHTDHELAAWLPSPSGEEIVLLGYSKVELADPKTTPDAPPLFKKAWIQTVNATTWEPTGKRASIDKGRAIKVNYAAGDQLVITTYEPAGRWELGKATLWDLDRTSGKLTKIKRAGQDARAQVTMTFDEVDAIGDDSAIVADWIGSPQRSASFRLADGNAPVTLAGGAEALRESFVWSPGKTRVAFATAGDPCAKAAEDHPGAIYVVEATTGKLKHVLTAQSRFAAVWLDDNRLVYEDDAGGLRVYDAAQGKEVAQIKEKAGMALRGLAASPKTICKPSFVPDVDPDAELDEYELMGENFDGLGPDSPDEGVDE